MTKTISINKDVWLEVSEEIEDIVITTMSYKYGELSSSIPLTKNEVQVYIDREIHMYT